MGCGFAGIVAGESTSDDAYKVVGTSHLPSVLHTIISILFFPLVAALNGIFALMALIGSVLHPTKFGSSFLFLASLQDVFWFFAIVRAGNFGVLETIGISLERAKKEADRMAGKAAERYAANGAEGAVKGGAKGFESEGKRALSTNPFSPVPPSAKD